MSWPGFDVVIESRATELPPPLVRTGLSRQKTLGLVRSLAEGRDVTVEVHPQGAGDKILVGLDGSRAYLAYHQAGDDLFQFSRARADDGLAAFVVGGQETHMEARLLLAVDEAVEVLDEVLCEGGLPQRSSHGAWEAL